MPLRLIVLIMAVGAVALGASVAAEPQAPPQRDPGVYVMKAAAAVRLTSQSSDQTTKGMGKSMLTGGFSRPSMEARIFGARADVRVAAGPTMFFLHINPVDPARNPMAYGMGGGDMPPQVRRATDVALVRLAIAEAGDERVADLGRVGGNNPKNQIEFVTTRLAAGVFKLDTKTPLTPGEYAFTIVPAGGGTDIWDFGVNPQ